MGKMKLIVPVVAVLVADAAGAACGSDPYPCGVPTPQTPWLRTSPAELPPACVSSGGRPLSCSDVGAVRLFDEGMLRPVGVVDDSTNRWQGVCVPHRGIAPYYRDARVVDGKWLVTSYGLGLAVWDIAPPREALPSPAIWADGVIDCRPGSPAWPMFPIVCGGSAEQLNFINGIDVANVGGKWLVLASGAAPLGFSAWLLDPPVLRALYQDGQQHVTGVLAVAHAGRHYAIALGGGQRSEVYDLEAIAALWNATKPVCERCGIEPRVPVSTSAPGVRLGQLPTAAESAAARSVGGALLLATAGGLLPPKLWDASALPGASMIVPLPPGSATVEWVGDRLVVEQAGTLLGLRPPSYTKVDWSWPAPSSGATIRTLRRLDLDGRSILYRGVLGRGAWVGGPTPELALELVAGRPVRDLAAGSAGYSDPCSGRFIDGRGWMLPGNSSGSNAYEPHALACGERYCYTAGESLLVVESLPPSVVIFTDGFESGDTSEWSKP